MQSIGAKVYIDGAGEFKNDLNTMIQATKTFKAELDAVNKADLNPFEKASLSKSALTKEIDAQKEKIELLKEKLQDAADKYGENSTQAMKWREQLEKANGALSTMEQQLKDIKNPLEIVGDEFQKCGDKLKSAGESISRAGDKLTTRVTMPIVGVLGTATKAAIDFESAMTGVQKTVDETANTSYDDLANSIKKLSAETGVAKEEIAGVMENAGQLGVGADQLEQFTKTMIDLGVSTNLTAEEASSAFAKFANVTKMPLEDVDRLGAALVGLGNNYATTEQDIMNMATRLSGAGAQIGLTQGEILGFATALSSVGIEAEMGGSAFSKAMIKMQVAAETGWDQVIELQNQTGMSLRELDMLSQNNSKDFKELADSLGLTKGEMQNTITAGKNLESFAEVAGMKTQDFVNLYRTDAPAALQAFITGLGDTESHGQTTIAMLQEMGFTEVRLRDTLTRLAQSSDLVVNAVAQGNAEWEQNLALTNEADKRYATTENRLAALKERLMNLAVDLGERLMPYVEKFINFADELMKKWDSLGPGTQDMIVKVALLTATLGPVLSVGGRLISGVGTLIKLGGGLIGGVGKIVSMFGGLGSGITGITGSLGGMVGAIGGGGGVIASLGGLASAAAPFLAGGAIVAGIGFGVYEIVKHWDDICDAASAVGDWVSGAWSDLCDATSKWWGDMTKGIGDAWDGITTVTKTAAKGVGDFLSDTWDAITHVASGAWDGIKGVISDAWDGISSFTVDAVTGIGNFLSGAWDSITNVASGAWNGLIGVIGSAWDGITSTVSNAVSGLGNLLSGAWDGITSAASSAWNGLKDIAGGALSAIGSAASSALDWGRDLATNIGNGISSGWNYVKGAVSDLAGGIASFLHFSVPDKGPLADADKYMPDMIKLMTKGIYQNIGMLEKAAGTMADVLTPTMATPTASGANATTTNVTHGDVVLNVYGANGQDVNELADIVMRKLTVQVNRQAVVYG